VLEAHPKDGLEAALVGKIEDAPGEHEAATHGSLHGGDDLLQPPRKVGENGARGREIATGSQLTKSAPTNGAREGASVSMTRTSTNCEHANKVDGLSKLEAQNALDGEPARVQPAECRRQLLRVLHGSCGQARLALSELPRGDLLHVGDAITVLVLLSWRPKLT